MIPYLSPLTNMLPLRVIFGNIYDIISAKSKYPTATNATIGKGRAIGIADCMNNPTINRFQIVDN